MPTMIPGTTIQMPLPTTTVKYKSPSPTMPNSTPVDRTKKRSLLSSTANHLTSSVSTPHNSIVNSSNNRQSLLTEDGDKSGHSLTTGTECNNMTRRLR